MAPNFFCAGIANVVLILCVCVATVVHARARMCEDSLPSNLHISELLRFELHSHDCQMSQFCKLLSFQLHELDAHWLPREVCNSG